MFDTEKRQFITLAIGLAGALLLGISIARVATGNLATDPNDPLVKAGRLNPVQERAADPGSR